MVGFEHEGLHPPARGLVLIVLDPVPLIPGRVLTRHGVLSEVGRRLFAFVRAWRQAIHRVKSLATLEIS